MIMKLSVVVAALASFAAMTAHAHVSLSSPCGRYQPGSGCPPPPAGQSVDYDIDSPIGTYESQDSPLCKHTIPYSHRTVYKAGETIHTEYSVDTSHFGGHCQYALSYDSGKTWVVIKTVIRDCLKGVPQGGKYTVPVQIPKDAPSGKVTFMWLWNNAEGNRELYSNCADIEIKGKDGGKVKGVAPLIANYGHSSFYIPEFPGANDRDGHEEFAKRKPITITVKGSGKSQSTTKPSPKPTSKPTKTKTVSPKPTKIVTPKPKSTKTTKTVTKVVTRTVTKIVKPTHCS
ncbi:hypothetical protein BGX21_002766 [Mortierella sp. AD011]|nr:hypothetical protein BGX20_011008 [Mortierella sp. AD010]KAF9378976.1 hypothetical protein BGX21_002766 [Mortierella sp. AD011]